MHIHVDFDAVTALFETAAREGRLVLFENEVYDLVRFSGAETLPRYFLHNKNDRLDPDRIRDWPGEKVVAKIVSPFITHKSDVNGVRVIDKAPDHLLSTVRSMLYEVPEAFAAQLARYPDTAPPAYEGLTGDRLVTAVAGDVTGVLVCQYMPDVTQEFGDELIVSLRNTREFGIVLTAGLGGTNTELYAETLKKGRATVVASTEMTDGETFYELFKNTISYQKLTGLTRGHHRVVTDEQLIECFSAFIALGRHFSPCNPSASFIIEELEINPFAFSRYLMLPLDGHCRFARPHPMPLPRPVNKIDKLLHPRDIGLIGVSKTKKNVGRFILKNILANGFDPAHVHLIHPTAGSIEGLSTFPDVSDLPAKVDLLILAVTAQQVPDLVDRILDNDLAESVLLIPGGLGEHSDGADYGRYLEEKIAASRRVSPEGPLLVGGNSLGILSHPGKYDTFFIPDDRLPKHRGEYLRKSAFISQSGAYMITRMSKLSFLDPAYAVSIGNQVDMTAADITRHINSVPSIRTVAAYMEGFKDLDGLDFARAVREAVQSGKDVIFYKAGRTPEGKTASSGHTASLASDYTVCESCIRQAGAMVAANFTGFEGLFKLSTALQDKHVTGNRLAAVSNAGYESVGIADNILGEDYRLEMAPLTPATRDKLGRIFEDAGLASLVNVCNPLDLTPMATGAVYENVIETLLADDTTDAVIAALVPLTPLLQVPTGDTGQNGLASDAGIAANICAIASRYSKPLIIIVDSGPLFDPLAGAFQDGGLAVFRSADQAVWVLGKYIQGKLSHMGTPDEISR